MDVNEALAQAKQEIAQREHTLNRFRHVVDVPFTPKADIRVRRSDVRFRFTSNSRHRNSVVECPLCGALPQWTPTGLKARSGALPITRPEGVSSKCLGRLFRRQATFLFRHELPL